MSDFQTYKKRRMESNPEFWQEYGERFETFKLGLMLKEARLAAGMTQQQVANRLNTTKSVISRMENHATDIRLTTLEKFAKVVGRHITISLG
jgi:ribosome-binding protein aMBF1 (putative translation factor)